jgi:hypothetical protein
MIFLKIIQIQIVKIDNKEFSILLLRKKTKSKIIKIAKQTMRIFIIIFKI